METKITQRFSETALYNKVLMYLIIAYVIVIALDVLINGRF